MKLERQEISLIKERTIEFGFVTVNTEFTFRNRKSYSLKNRTKILGYEQMYCIKVGFG